MNEWTDLSEPIRRLIDRLAPIGVCDGCIAQHLTLPLADELRARLGAITVERGYLRERDQCSLCAETRAVTRKSR